MTETEGVTDRKKRERACPASDMLLRLKEYAYQYKYKQAKKTYNSCCVIA